MAQASRQTTAATDGATGPAPVAAQPGRPPAEAAVPERPALAPGVTLVGEMQGTGFADRQWLVTRHGRFLQVSELIFRVLEQADGERTFQEIADRVTEATDWLVSADQARRLVQTKLAPLGLVAPAAGTAGPLAGGPARSTLQVNLRTRLLGPRLLDPLTGVLQWLYAPPVLLVMLAAIAVAHWWLYARHGLTGAVHAVLFTPGGLLVVLALAVASGLVHELGHAAALRYGGGRARGIGAGIYFAYPVFYCDATDSYRLGRWARVRTDLGGFYFHGIFALALVALHGLTGYELPLALVPLIGLLLLRECIPFLRLDGYWVLADLTGVPDFFSQVGPFLRSLLPASKVTGVRLPPLRRWVKAVFAAYLLAAVPALALLYYLLVSSAPYVLMTTWDAALHQAELFSAGRLDGDALLMATAGAQMLLLALPAVGIVYILVLLARGLARGIWRFSQPTPARRLAGACAALGVVGALGFLWTPALSSSGRPAPPAGVRSVPVAQRTHVDRPVLYPHKPPLGGNHAPLWQNCGFYDGVIPNEQAVHALEHGAVWVTYRPDLPAAQVEALHEMTRDEPYLLVSPYPGLPAPVVASAWGEQLRLDSTEDPRLGQFVRAFRLGPRAPEAGGPCIGGAGAPR